MSTNNSGSAEMSPKTVAQRFAGSFRPLGMSRGVFGEKYTVTAIMIHVAVATTVNRLCHERFCDACAPIIDAPNGPTIIVARFATMGG